MADRYQLADDPPPRRPSPVLPPQPVDGDDDAPPPWHEGFDPFPLLLGAVCVTWAVLGFAARGRPLVALALVVAGVLVLVLSKLYLLWIIHQEDPKSTIWALLFDWYESVWCTLNVELVWKPLVLTGCGLLMMLTGGAVGLRR